MIDINQYSALTEDQKRDVLRLPANSAVLNRIRGGQRDKRHPPLASLDSITDRELVALGNVAFRMNRELKLYN